MTQFLIEEALTARVELDELVEREHEEALADAHRMAREALDGMT